VFGQLSSAREIFAMTLPGNPRARGAFKVPANAMRTLVFGILLVSSVSLAQPVPAPQLPSLSPLIASVKGAVVAIDIAKRPSE
jgi:hypothetical protein